VIRIQSGAFWRRSWRIDALLGTLRTGAVKLTMLASITITRSKTGGTRGRNVAREVLSNHFRANVPGW
jgi:hypothetical protein